MKIKRKKGIKNDIADSGALSDLAFLLIIFFIVIAVFTVNKGFILELPKKNSQKLINVDDIMKLRLNETGEIWLEKKRLGLNEIDEKINDMLALHPNASVLLHIHGNTKYQRVVGVIEKVRAIGVENFSFSMKGDN